MDEQQPGMSRREALATGSAAIAAASLTASPAWGAAPARPVGREADHVMWYDRPADRPIDCLLVGNGRLGAMTSGQPHEETLHLNEDSLWSGQPRPFEMKDARDALAKVREAVFAGRYAVADRETQAIQGRFSDSYAPLADLHLALDHAGPVADYRRSLDLDEAVVRTSYRIGDVAYRRELFASHPAQIVLLRLTADRRGMLSLSLMLDSQLRHTVHVDDRTITLRGKAPTYCAPNYKADADPVVYDETAGMGMAFATRLELLTCDGAVERDTRGLRIRGATEVVIAIGAATGFRGFDKAPDTPIDTVVHRAGAPVERVRATAWGTLLAEHVADHRSLYRRLGLTLGMPGATDIPTDRRMAANGRRHDPSLAVLYMNFSRYLLIASSRTGTQAANLQGIWSWQVRPPWSSNYTTNINIQQNYWGAEACNLAELAGPMIDFVAEAAVSGRETARRLYRMNGWVVHHNSDLWRLTTPVGEGTGGPSWANFVLAGPWLVRHVWEHYLYSRDRAFLAERAYPLLKGCAEFCADWLVRDPRTGGLTTAPSVSTENVFRSPDGATCAVSAGCTYDIAAIREVFGFTREAAALLGVDAPFAARLGQLAERLPAYRIGRHGQLQEWEADFEEAEPQQRHISHLYPVAPGWEITPRSTPALARAASVSMQRRLAAGGGGTGWSRAWTIHVFARLGDARRALRNLDTLVNTSTTPALLDVLPSGEGVLFQIDGNFAGGAAVIEMILQSHAGVIAFLPALPPEWGDGQLDGVRARGGMAIDMRWAAGRMAGATLRPHVDGTHDLRVPPGQRITRILDGRRAVPFVLVGDDCRVALSAGRTYAVRFA